MSGHSVLVRRSTWSVVILISSLAGCAGGGLTSRSGNPSTPLNAIEVLSRACFDETVTDVVEHPDRVFVAGEFAYVGRCSGTAVTVDTSNGALINSIDNVDKVEGEVYAAVSDGSGGWYIGGAFLKVGQSEREYLAQIDANGKVTTFAPSINGRVYTLAVANGKLFVGGDFTSLGGQPRSNVGAINLSDSSIDAWAPSINSDVSVILATNDKVIVGGWFTQVNSVSNPYLAAFSLSSGAQISWNPNPDGNISALAFGEGQIYVGGSFYEINSIARSNLAAFDATTLALNSTWDPVADSSVSDLLYSNSRVYAAGDFTQIDGVTSVGLTSLHPSSGTQDATFRTNLALSDRVSSLAFASGNLYFSISASGINSDFSVNGTERRYLASVNATTGVVNAWAPSVIGFVNVVQSDGTQVFFGGQVSAIEAVARYGLVAFEKEDGSVETWNADLSEDAEVMDLELVDDQLIVGGYFDSAGGQPRNNLASLSTSTALANSWNPGTSGTVLKIDLHDDTIYFAGNFTMAGGATRIDAAAVSVVSGSLTSWNPNPTGDVWNLQVDETGVYVSGSFTNIGGQARSRLARLDLSTGSADSWSPVINNDIYEMEICGTNLYVGGRFTTINTTETRNRIAGFSLSTGDLLTWNPNANNQVEGLACNDTYIYASGNFTTVGGQSRSNLAELSLQTGNATARDFNQSDRVSGLLLRGEILGVFGSSTMEMVSGKWRPWSAFFDLERGEVRD